MKEAIRVKVFRFNPEKDEAPYYKTYEVPVEGPMSVLALLNYIYRELDQTLAYSGEHICYKGVCTTCMALVNGKAERTCMRIASPGEQVVIEPLKGQPVIRDLVTDPGRQITTKDGIFFVKKGVIVEIKQRGD